MKYAFFTITALNPGEGKEELNRFLSSRRIINVEKHFVADGQGSFWAFSITYESQEGKLAATNKNKIDYKEILNEKDFALFSKLRTLRKNLAEEQGVPAYALFTNEQLAEMVRRQTFSLATLGEIEGIGKARLDKYGELFISLMREEIGKEQKTKTGDDETSTH